MAASDFETGEEVNTVWPREPDPISSARGNLYLKFKISNCKSVL